MLSLPTETVRAHTRRSYRLWQPALCADRSLNKAACPTLDQVEAEMTQGWMPRVRGLCTWCECSWQNSCKDWAWQLLQSSSNEEVKWKKTGWGRLDWKPSLISVPGSMWIQHRVVLTSSKDKVLPIPHLWCIVLIRESPRTSVWINKLWVSIWSWLFGLQWDWPCK